MTDRLKQRASAAGESLRERASDLGERAGELGHEACRRARHYGRSGGRYVKDHPILIGAAGIALGAAGAAALQRTYREADGEDRKSVGEGKRGALTVDYGGGRSTKKK